MTQCFSIFLFFHNSRELLIAVNHPDDITHLQHSDNRKRFTFLEKLTYNSNDNYCRSFKVQGDHVHARFQLSRKHIFFFFFSFSSRQFHLPPKIATICDEYPFLTVKARHLSPRGFHTLWKCPTFHRNVFQRTSLCLDIDCTRVSAQLCTRVSSKKAFDVSISGEKSRKNSLPSLWKRFTSMIRSVLEPVSRNFKVD